MNWSFRVGTLVRIPIYLHWTFALLLGWIAFSQASQGKSYLEILAVFLFVFGIFSCVLLHELGHALTARSYGIRTRNITMLPIGGVAQLERMPRKPSQELLVALAGPAVNVVIAILLLPVVFWTSDWARLQGTTLMHTTFLVLPAQLLGINIMLVLFNLIPAFPMDGGRVLRALLASWMAYAKATRIAARVGQGVAAIFALVGLFGLPPFLAPNPFLLFIAFFVFLGAEAEAQAAEVSSAFENVQVKNALQRTFQALDENESLAHASSQLLASSQRDFPIVNAGGRCVGILTRDRLIYGVKAKGYGARIGDFMQITWPSIDLEDSLEETYRKMMAHRLSMIPLVNEEGKVIGILTNKNIHEYMMLSSAVRSNRA